MTENSNNFFIYGCVEFEMLCQLCKDNSCDLNQAINLLNNDN